MSRERELFRLKHTFIAGLDEVGRGSLAGPVVASAVVFHKDCFIEGLKDSKLLSECERERLFGAISQTAVDWAVNFVFEETIDDVNIKNATHMAMLNAVDALKVKPNYLLIDGNDGLPFEDFEYEYIIKGDFLCSCISAASIVAKVARDRYMKDISAFYPEYGFDKHKGYATRVHLDSIRKHGISRIHRKTFMTPTVLGA